ncbi:hypothetical protein B0F90DRAFT_1669935 [Multifurca ochricompacta]|uniref:Uncharacterized protein n=1 Tax=Multifurca ochricompacta TaxID=376703 RepID=A0AAD4QL74_9AGAM|nr:hypothetical protein B0F90DRAFT_1669935 [Multifurca ochricompacta]
MSHGHISSLVWHDVVMNEQTFLDVGRNEISASSQILKSIHRRARAKGGRGGGEDSHEAGAMCAQDEVSVVNVATSLPPPSVNNYSRSAFQPTMKDGQNSIVSRILIHGRTTIGALAALAAGAEYFTSQSKEMEINGTINFFPAPRMDATSICCNLDRHSDPELVKGQAAVTLVSKSDPGSWEMKMLVPVILVYRWWTKSGNEHPLCELLSARSSTRGVLKFIT